MAAHPLFAPKPDSLFADKLKQALAACRSGAGRLMPRTARDTPPPLELLCLNALWSLQEGNVKAVQQWWRGPGRWPTPPS